MSGDFSNSAHELTWTGSGPITQGEKVIFDGGNRRISASASADWCFTGDLTMEMFGTEFSNISDVSNLIGSYGNATDRNSFLWRFDGSVSPKKMVLIYELVSATSTSVEANWSPTINTPYDICIDRSGTTLRMYVDGSMIGSFTVNGQFVDSLVALNLGHSPHTSTATGAMHGAFKAVRITNGVARYASDGGYTVPTLPLPTS